MKKSPIKKVDDLSVSDLERCPVWEFTNAHEIDLDETAMRAVQRLPVDTLSNRLIGTKVSLANGIVVWALLGNVDVHDSRATQHFMTATFFHDGQRFNLARYHDFDSREHGPMALASFLGLNIDAVFPISYDLGGFCRVSSWKLKGTIEKEPKEVLTPAQLMELTFP